MAAIKRAPILPYTYYQCPCTNESTPPRTVGELTPIKEHEDEEEDDGQTFDPRSPRANYSLYPLEHLLYCEDCHQIRCEKCVLDEIVTFYCPNCLFEVAGSGVKSDGLRCTRSCFQCPSCTSPLAVSSLESTSASSLLGADQATQSGPWVLSCLYCNWSSKEIGITFEKPNGIYSQLSKIKNGGERMVSRKERDYEERQRQFSATSIPEIASPIEADEEETKRKEDERLSNEAHFANLKSFYQSMLSDSTVSNNMPFTGDYGFSSPGTLSRIMGLYSSGLPLSQKSKPKNNIFRESKTKSEGLQPTPTANDESQAISRLQNEGWDTTVSPSQNENQSQPQKFVSDLRPFAHLLRTKRSKRCRTCRHILTKPESKIQTTRFRIRQVALNYLPTITLKPLQPTSSSRDLLRPLLPIQYLITLHNPLFEDLKIALLTPSQTPGRFSSKITILCPEFEVGAKKDEWDEALGDGAEKRRTRAEASEGQNQGEAGKVWERGRDWTSVVVEIVPASLNLSNQIAFLRKEGEAAEEMVGEDEDVLEIPVFVRMEWETRDDHETKEGDKGTKEKHELAYWCVLGVGRIAMGE